MEMNNTVCQKPTAPGRDEKLMMPPSAAWLKKEVVVETYMMNISIDTNLAPSIPLKSP